MFAAAYRLRLYIILSSLVFLGAFPVGYHAHYYSKLPTQNPTAAPLRREPRLYDDDEIVDSISRDLEGLTNSEKLQTRYLTLTHIWNATLARQLSKRSTLKGGGEESLKKLKT